MRTVPHGFGGKLLGLFALRCGPVAGVGVHQFFDVLKRVARGQPCVRGFFASGFHFCVGGAATLGRGILILRFFLHFLHGYAICPVFGGFEIIRVLHFFGGLQAHGDLRGIGPDEPRRRPVT